MFESETVWEFSMADSVKFGTNAVEELPDEIDNWDGDTALIVTDEGVKTAGVVDQIRDQFPASMDVSVFAGVEPDPSLAVFEEAIEIAGEVEPDVIVGVGGGSSIDVSKTTGLVHEHGGEIMDYVAPPTGEGKPVPGPTVPVVAIPTTAGTGSETSPVSVISLPDRKLKVGISSEHLYPDLALIDPALTVSLPTGPTASSGMDALSHAIEAYTTRRYDAKERADSPADRPDYNGRSPLTDELARKAIELISDNLRRAVNNGEDLEARRNMSLASFMAGVAFTNAGLGATHAMAYPVAGEHHTPHGVTIATLLPEVIRFNATTAFDRYADIAQLMGEETEGLDRSEAANKAADAVAKLGSDVGIPGSLEDLGVTEDELPKFAEETMQIQRLLVGNPRRVDQDDVESIFRQAL
ncbi:hydroxyacid-oxoacid transhydrogenase [Haloarchaeobius sp. DYHT-AS-18]|uniref:hydroxyacid-oxoacid transhydrogenase n=1 Tax=Haloarchaeobius sp. DYHT-AS-18 TaxID=3446117 RepID=UPI003EB9B9F3